MNFRNPVRLTLAALLSVGLTACGGGGGGSSTTPVAASPTPVADNTGVVAVAMKDGPTDDFVKLLVRITGVELLGNGAPVSIFDGDKEIDLLELENFYEMLGVSDEVPVGDYDKIRLHVASVDLVKEESDGTLSDPISVPVPANGKIDLNPRGSFTVSADTALLIELDMDAKRSIHVVKLGNGDTRYRLRPLVFVSVYERQLLDGLVRVHGTIGDIADDNSSFELCDVDIQFSSGPDNCIVINVVPDETSIFDSEGQAIDLEDVRNETPPVEATVFGHAVVADIASSDDGDSDSGSDMDDDSDSGSSMDDDSEGDSDSDSDDDTVRMVQIDAIVVQLGPDSAALQLDGTILSDIDADNLFSFGIDPGQGFTDGSIVNVLVQNETKILSEDLTVLDPSVLLADTRARVAGVLSVGDSDQLNSTLIIVEDAEVPTERLNGPVIEIQDTTFTIGEEMGNQCVEPTADARFFFFDSSEGLVEEAGLADMQTRLDAGPLNATAFGSSWAEGCFQADLITTYLPEETPPES
jgi:hypothetical protein